MSRPTNKVFTCVQPANPCSVARKGVPDRVSERMKSVSRGPTVFSSPWDVQIGTSGVQRGQMHHNDLIINRTLILHVSTMYVITMCLHSYLRCLAPPGNYNRLFTHKDVHRREKSAGRNGHLKGNSSGQTKRYHVRRELMKKV